MTTNCHDQIALLENATTVEDIHTICSNFCSEMGYENFLYGARIPTTLTNPSFIYITDYPSSWRDHYTEQRYIAIDPTVSHCIKHITPIKWENIPNPNNNKTLKKLMDEAAGVGLKNGISFPAHTSTGESVMFSVAIDGKQSQQQTNKTTPFGQLFTAHLHEAVRRVFSQEFLPISKVHLTQREQECLLWSADGKTTWEISQILNISERTVVYHIQNSTSKLGVANRQQAVARAITSGLINASLQ